MTTENNKIIAEFMGVKQDLESGNYRLPHYSGKYVVNPLTQGRNYDEWADRYTDENYNTGYLLPLEYLQYNTSFDWLMEVVEKIESLGHAFSIDGTKCYVLTNDFCNAQNEATKIESVYKVCLGFIKWYNEQNN